MSKDRNLNQIIRKDARGCFVESLNDVFSIGKAHLAFVAYDLHSPAGQRQTDNIHIYLDIAELLELCRKAESGELRQSVQAKKRDGDKSSLYQCVGGTSAERLRQLGKPRADGMSLSRVFQLLPGSRSDFLLVADSGPGERDATWLGFSLSPRPPTWRPRAAPTRWGRWCSPLWRRPPFPPPSR